MSKVIKILDEYNIIVSREDLEVSSKTVLEIFEPGPSISYNGQDFGNLDIIKAELRIKTIYPKMLLCESNKYTKSKVAVPSVLLNPFSTRYQEIENIAPLNIEFDDSDTSINFNTLSKIRLGDTVRVKK